MLCELSGKQSTIHIFDTFKFNTQIAAQSTNKYSIMSELHYRKLKNKEWRHNVFGTLSTHCKF